MASSSALRGAVGDVMRYALFAMLLAAASSCSGTHDSSSSASSSANVAGGPSSKPPLDGSAAPSASASAPRPTSYFDALPQSSSPPELDNTISLALGDSGWSALVLESGADAALTRPAILLGSRGRDLERITLPFSSAGDLKGSASFRAASLLDQRFLVAEGNLPKVRLRVWEPRGYVGEAVEGVFGLFGGSAITSRQAIAVEGKMDRNGMVLAANGSRAARHRNGAWSFVGLPPPAEKSWSDCFWDATPMRASGAILLAQICVAPKHPRVYALFKLEADADAFERVPFDNDLFTGVQTARGVFHVEADGTIDLGNLKLGKPDGAYELARLRAGKTTWELVRVEIPTRLATSACAAGDRVVVSDGGVDVRESSDGGRTFHSTEPLEDKVGMIGSCNASLFAFTVQDREPRRSHVVLRRWSGAP
ncbi:MAG: hypothetical protein U0271_14465 [Polyangiaceae bacterium]